MASTNAAAASTKRAFKDINVEKSTTAVASKKVKMISSRPPFFDNTKPEPVDTKKSAEFHKPSILSDPIIKASLESRAADIKTIKSILNSINDPIIKASLEDIIKNSTKTWQPFPTVTPKKSEAALEKLTKQTIKTIQQCMNEKLKWKNSYKQLKDGATKGGRVEMACTDPEVFKRIFSGLTIKKGKDGKLSCSAKTNEEADKWKYGGAAYPSEYIPFDGRSYRYNRSELCPPFSASLNPGLSYDILTFNYKFTIL